MSSEKEVPLKKTKTETDPPFQIFVKTLSGNTITVNVKNNETVYSLKTKIEKSENITPELQRLIYSTCQLEDDKTMEDYTIKKESTIHMVVRLRGNGDMLKNHILNISPKNGSIGAAVDGVISIRFDESVDSIDTPNLFKVFYKNTKEEITGISLYHCPTRTASFLPHTILPQSTEILVQINAHACEKNVDHEWTFSTEKLKPCTLFIMEDCFPDKVKITLDRSGWALYNELVAKIMSKHDCSFKELRSIKVKDSDVKIEDDNDVLQLRDNETLIIKIVED